MTGSGSPFEALEAVRTLVIEADNKVVAQANDLIEPLDRLDMVARQAYLADVSRLAGIREGLEMARVAVEEVITRYEY